MVDEKDWSRLRIVRIPYGLLLEMFSERSPQGRNRQTITSITSVEGFPGDAEILGHIEDIQSRSISLRVWSSEFDPVPDGNLIPPLNLVVKHRELI